MSGDHPAPFTWSLVSRFIEMFPSVTSLLDPFCGTGTTLFQAKRLNRQAIGIEIEPKVSRDRGEEVAQEAGVLMTWLVFWSPLLFAACASDPSWPYTKPETTEAMRRADYAGCVEQFKPIGWASGTGAQIAYHACMRDLGYSQVEWTR